jgi:hypothetical protein
VLDVDLSVDFAALQTVYIVNSLAKKERIELEAQAELEVP